MQFRPSLFLRAREGGIRYRIRAPSHLRHPILLKLSRAVGGCAASAMEDQIPTDSKSEDPKTPLLLPIRSDPPVSPPASISVALRSLFTFKSLCIASGPLACAVVCLAVDLNGETESRNMLAVLAWMFIWWLTEAIPMPVTSMAPLFLFPSFGIATADAVAKSYMNDVVALLLGSFTLALAVEHYNIHRRLAMKITMVFCGDHPNPPLLLLGICGTSAFVSMWIHNTAAAMMMMPVATGILQHLPEHDGRRELAGFCKAVVLGVIFSTTIGGMCTLTGTGVNLILVGMWQSYFPLEEPIGFSTWFFFGFPLAVFIFLALWAILCALYCRRDSATALAPYLDKAHLRRELQLLGPMAFEEKMVLAIFGVLVGLWMTRSLSNDIPGWAPLFHGRVGDGSVSVMMATLLFIVPNGKHKGEKLMDWNKCRNLPWNIILLLGAGFAIADGVHTSGLADLLSKSLRFLDSAPRLAIAPAVCLMSSAITEFTSNDATATLVLPLLIQLAKPIGVHPLLLMVPGAVGAQLSFLVPTATPSNAVAFATGHVDIRDMVVAGLPLKAFGIAAVSLLMPTLGTFVFQTKW